MNKIIYVNAAHEAREEGSFFEFLPLSDVWLYIYFSVGSSTFVGSEDFGVFAATKEALEDSKNSFLRSAKVIEIEGRYPFREGVKFIEREVSRVSKISFEDAMRELSKKFDWEFEGE